MTAARTKTIVLTILGAIASFLIASILFAGDALALGAKPSPNYHSQNSGRTWRVRCNRGATLSKALKRARENDTVLFSGTCQESVAITTDNLTIVGTAGATIDGTHGESEAVLLIDGARGIVLKNFSVVNGGDQGILAENQAQAQLSNISSQNNGTVGLSVDRSHLELVDLTLDNNAGGGMDAFASSTVVAKGILSANGNGGDGLAANGKTFFELRGAAVVASQNIGTGVSIINDSRLQIFSFPEAQGSTINADNNGFAGIGLLGSEMGVVGSQYFGSGANVINANNNGVFGFFAPAGAILSPHATAQFVAQGNGVGMLFEDGGSALIIGGLNLSQNGAGLSAHGAGTLTLVSVPPNPSTVDQNQIDFDLGFGTRVTTDGVGHTSVSCDASVLTRGLECPASE